MDEIGASVSNDLEQKVTAEQNLGKTISYIAIEKKFWVMLPLLML